MKVYRNLEVSAKPNLTSPHLRQKFFLAKPYRTIFGQPTFFARIQSWNTFIAKSPSNTWLLVSKDIFGQPTFQQELNLVICSYQTCLKVIVWTKIGERFEKQWRNVKDIIRFHFLESVSLAPKNFRFRIIFSHFCRNLNLIASWYLLQFSQKRLVGQKLLGGAWPKKNFWRRSGEVRLG